MVFDINKNNDNETSLFRSIFHKIKQEDMEVYPVNFDIESL